MKRVLAVLAAAVMWSAAGAEPVVVQDYNWLQLGPKQVESFVGKPGDGNAFLTVDNDTTRAHGAVNDIRWGNFVWIPSLSLTDNGQGTYWAGVKLDQPRSVTSVNVLLWNSPTEKTKQFFIDAYVGGKWVEIGASEAWYDAPITDHRVVSVDVKDGQYDCI